MSDPAVNDEYAAANYAYTEALWVYEDAIVSRDPERREMAHARLRQAGARLSRAQSAIAASRRPQGRVTFDALLTDPTQQLDPNGEVLASVVAYQNATTATASTTSPTARHDTDTKERVMPATFVCAACNETLPISDEGPTGGDGSRWCGECAREGVPS